MEIGNSSRAFARLSSKSAILCTCECATLTHGPMQRMMVPGVTPQSHILVANLGGVPGRQAARIYDVSTTHGSLDRAGETLGDGLLAAQLHVPMQHPGTPRCPHLNSCPRMVQGLRSTAGGCQSSGRLPTPAGHIRMRC